MVVIGMGTGSERVGLITHGDVQPVDPAKWKKSPFELDRTSEPGRLLGRGTEDDKSSIATAMLAMKAIRDLQLPLKSGSNCMCTWRKSPTGIPSPSSSRRTCRPRSI